MRRPIRVAILSDTHGVLDPRIADEVTRCDYAVHAGDLGARVVAEQLRPRVPPALVVRGNNDVAQRWPAEDRDFLAGLPGEGALELPGGTLVVVHGDRAGAVRERHCWLRRRYPNARLIVYGHSHRLCLDRDAVPWVVNPGAAGRARTFGGPSLIVLTIGASGWRLRPKRFPSVRSGRRNPRR